MSTNDSGPARRRSLRLSAKKDAQNNAEAGKTSDDAIATTDPNTPKIDALPETGASHETHIEADFTDDEVDADVCCFPLICGILSVYPPSTGV